MSSYETRAGLAEIDNFDVIGVSVITNNQTATDDINALWERFFKESVGQAIPNKTDDIIYAVYSDYEGDFEAPYRLTIGYRVNSAETPNGMHRAAVEGGEYAVMSAAGKQPDALLETWKAIWSEQDLGRAYKTDFEIYGPRFFEDGINEVLVHIGINNDN